MENSNNRYKFRAWLKKKFNPEYQEWLKNAMIDRNIGSISQYEKEIGKTFNEGFVSGMENNICVSYNGKMMMLEGGWDYQGDIDAEIMQFIGLKDTKKNDIYEGDILEFWPLKKYNKFNLIGIVEYYNKETRFRIVEKTDLGETFWGFSQLDKFYIIGNIYENHELIK